MEKESMPARSRFQKFKIEAKIGSLKAKIKSKRFRTSREKYQTEKALDEIQRLRRIRRPTSPDEFQMKKLLSGGGSVVNPFTGRSIRVGGATHVGVVNGTYGGLSRVGGYWKERSRSRSKEKKKVHHFAHCDKQGAICHAPFGNQGSFRAGRCNNGHCIPIQRLIA